MKPVPFRQTIRRFGCLLVSAVFVVTIPLQLGAQVSNTEQSNAGVDDIRLRYAQKQLDLAMLELKDVQGQNRSIPGSYSPLAIMQLEHNVTQARLQLDYEESKLGEPDSHPALHQLHLGSLSAAAELVKKQLEWIEVTNERSPGLYRDEQILRFRLNAELSRLALENARNPKLTSSPIAHLQWQVNQLQSEVAALRLELDRVHSANR